MRSENDVEMSFVLSGSFPAEVPCALSPSWVERTEKLRGERSRGGGLTVPSGNIFEEKSKQVRERSTFELYAVRAIKEFPLIPAIFRVLPIHRSRL